jgi:hypothetical protein
LDYLEKLLAILGLGLIPFFLIIVALAFVPSETAENSIIDTSIISVFISSFYIIFFYFKKRNQ